ncbi:hypothetical protein T492DRAFT_989966 [Pavlovales sp. CCMP2436]|nr:hypothetical protein T492DRAFT_989966 [Pavlovales sp. CCMP2436]|mmetsp:Transcript_35337/g.88149  ORF Transcript_35337/g.88149 Transcript_35337/m.88149 type:complete len:551 (-) Transcript_35337:63-1715(-)
MRHAVCVLLVGACALTLVIVPGLWSCAGLRSGDWRTDACARLVTLPSGALLPQPIVPGAHERPPGPARSAQRVLLPSRATAALSEPLFLPSSCSETVAGRPHEVCLVSSLSSAYLDGHEVFMRSLAGVSAGSAIVGLPLYLFDDGLSTAERARACAISATSQPTVILPLPATVPAQFSLERGTKWASNLRKLFAIFELGARCLSVVKLDTGDMLAMRDPSELVQLATNSSGHVFMAQALVYGGNLNGGLAVFQRGVLCNETRSLLIGLGQANDSYREQWMLRKWLRGRGRSRFQELPKRFNVEWSYWQEKHAGPLGSPSLAETVLLHYVGDKPWAQRRKGAAVFDALWWAHFGLGRMVVVGSSALAELAGAGEGWLLDSFEGIARIGAEAHSAAQAKDLGARPGDCSLDALLAAAEERALLTCFARVRPRGVFVVGLAAAEQAVVARAWLAHTGSLCTAASRCAAGGGGRPLLDVHVRALRQMRPVKPPKLRGPMPRPQAQTLIAAATQAAAPSPVADHMNPGIPTRRPLPPTQHAETSQYEVGTPSRPR